MIKPDITFALVKTFHRYGKNHFSSFLPLVIDCAQQLPDEYIVVSDLKNKYKELYGLDIPSNVIKKILLTGKEAGYFEFSGELIKKGPSLGSNSIRDVQSKYLKEHDFIIDSFINYHKISRNQIIDKITAEKAMYEFMDENVYKLIKNSTNYLKDAVQISGSDIKISFGRYIRNAIESEETVVVEYISDIAKGVMIQNAIYLPNIDTLERRFTDTKLIIDTPLILSLLGYAGDERKIPVLELVEMAKNSGAEIVVFDFTVSEVGSVLDSCAERLRNSSRTIHGKTIEYFIEQKFTYEEVLIFKGRIERDLKRLNVAIIQKPEYIPSYCLDEIELEKNIDKHLHYQYESSKRKDISAISGTYRLREGKSSIYLEASGAIFITSNYGLVKAAKELEVNKRGCIDIVMTEFYITNILWLKKPTKFPNLPTKRVIADIVSALQPSDSLWNTFITEAEAMESRGEITYEDVLVLRTSTQTPDLVFDASNGGISTLAPSSIKEILEEINHNKEQEFIKIRDDRIKNRAKKIANTISFLLSWILLFIVIAGSLKDVIIPLVGNQIENMNIIKTAFSGILIVLSILNIAIGTTINIIKKNINKVLSKILFRMFKKITD